MIVSHIPLAALNTLEKTFSTNPSNPCLLITSSKENAAPIIPPILLPASVNIFVIFSARPPICDNDISEELPSCVMASDKIIRLLTVLSLAFVTLVSAFVTPCWAAFFFFKAASFCSSVPFSIASLYSFWALVSSSCAIRSASSCSGKSPSRPPLSIIVVWMLFRASSITFFCSTFIFLYSGESLKDLSCNLTSSSDFLETLLKSPKMSSQLIPCLNCSISIADKASVFCFSNDFFSHSFWLAAIFSSYSNAIASFFCWNVPYSFR